MKIIFLDIDGVLNSEQYFSSKEYTKACEDIGIKNSFSQDVIDKAPYLLLDPVKINILNYLVEKSYASIVLSSSWRLKYSINEVNDFLKIRGSNFCIIDSTPIKMSYCNRETEINLFLSSLKEYKKIVPESFAILDDNNFFYNYTKQFVHVSDKTGLTISDVVQALSILNKT